MTLAVPSFSLGLCPWYTGSMWGVRAVFAMVGMVTMCSGQVKDTYQVPRSHYDYYAQRQSLQDGASQLAGWRYPLTEDDQVVDRYLQYLKWQQFTETKDTGFYPSRPIEEVLDDVTSTPLYDVLRQLPKGGNMHSHENHQVSKRKLLEIVWASDDFEHLYIVNKDNKTNAWMLEFFLYPPQGQGWVRVKYNQRLYSLDTVYKNQVLMYTMSEYARRYVTDSGERWRQMEPLWERGSSQLINNYVIKEQYVEAMYVQQAEDGVQYYESRHSLSGGLYVLDPNAIVTFGKRNIDYDGRLDINLTLSVLDKVKQRYPHFIGHKRLYSSRRNRYADRLANDMENVRTLREAYPHFILGYDLVNEEDLGYSLLYHLDTFLPLENSLQSGNSQLPLYFHAGETSWMDDLVSTSDPSDPVATIENLLDVVLLNTKRIGHGIALVKYPYLQSVVKDRGIAIEVCPVSNQILGYVPDLRNHPAVNFLRSGNVIVLGADDPGTFGYDNFTVDWYQAYMAWGLDLADLKTLAYNSLMYSGLTSDEKTDAVNKWKLQWGNFTATVKAKACSTNFKADNTNVTFGKIFPRQVTDHQPINNITVYGRNFHTAICQKVVCKFNDVISEYARYITNFKLVCQLPPRVSGDTNVTVHVSLDGGQTFTVAGNITYIASNITYVTSQRVNNAAVNQNNVTLLLWFAVLFSILWLLKS